MPEKFADLLKRYAAMPLADRRAIEKRLGDGERLVLRNCLHPKRSKPTNPSPEPRFNFEAYSPGVAKRLAEILIIGKAPADATAATKAALRRLVPSSLVTEGSR